MSKGLFNSGCIRALMAVFFFTIMFPPIVAAQEGESGTPGPKHSLEDGAWALQFGFGSALSRRSFGEPDFSVKYHLSDRRAVRLGIGVDGLITFGNNDRHSGQTKPDSLEYAREFDSNGQDFELTAEYIFYSSPGSNIHILWGAGPLLEYHRRFEKTMTANYRPDGIHRHTYETKTNTWAFGISGALGAEWFFLRRVSIFAEYGIELEYRYTDRKMTGTSRDEGSQTEDKAHTNTFDLDLKTSKIGLSVYF